MKNVLTRGILAGLILGICLSPVTIKAANGIRGEFAGSVALLSPFTLSFGAFSDTGAATLTKGGTNVVTLGPAGAALALTSTTVAALPAAAAGNAGQIRYVSDSTAVAAEGQTCAGSSTNKALAFSNGSAWKCF